MKAAITASDRGGHKVTIIEKQKELGGMLRFISKEAHKEEVQRLLDYYLTQIFKREIEVLLNTEADPELVKELQPDSLLIAFGGQWREFFQSQVWKVKKYSLRQKQSHIRSSLVRIL